MIALATGLLARVLLLGGVGYWCRYVVVNGVYFHDLNVADLMKMHQ